MAAVAAVVKLPSSRQLAKTAVKDFWQYRAKIVGAVSIIAVPLSLLGLIPGLDQDASYQAYNSIARTVMITGLIWLVVELKNRHLPAIGDVYYRGIGALVRMFLLVSSFFMMAVPFLLGLLFYSKGLQSTVVPTGAEKLLLGLVWAVFGVPSVWLLSRFVLSVYALTDQDLSPVAALRDSNQRVRGRTLKVLGRIIALLVFSVLALAITVLASSLLAFSPALAIIAQLLLQLASIIVLLPVANFYLFDLYQSLKPAR